MLNIYSTPSAADTNILTNSKTLSANNTTANVQLFRITGVVRVVKLYGIVTTVLGANHTGSFFRLNDQSAVVELTSSTSPTALSAAAVGTVVAKNRANNTIATVSTSAAGRVSEAASASIVIFTNFYIVKKNGANTDIEYTYTTTDAPTSGVIQFFVEYAPLSADGAVAAL